MSVPRRAARSLLTAAVCLVAAAVPVTSAVGDDTTVTSRQAKTIHVTGLLELTDVKKGVFKATGDLDGTWTIPPSATTDYYNTPTTIIQKGTESFRGCLKVGKGRCGTLNSEYISWSYLRPDGRLISGGCTHAPTGGTAGFRGLRGLIMMTDIPVGDDVTTVYQAELILNAKWEEGPMPIPDARPASSRAAVGAGTC